MPEETYIQPPDDKAVALHPPCSVTGCCLREGPSDGTLLEIEPDMKTLRHKGDDYHRVDTATRIVNGQRYRCFLWEHWSP